jgi:hypothetical protein
LRILILLERSRPRYLIATLVAALLLLGSVVGGCFGGDGGKDVDKLLNQAFNGNQKVDSGKLNMELSARLKGAQEGAEISGPVSVKVSGRFEGLEEKIKDSKRLPRTDLDVSVSAAGQDFQAGGVSTGDKLFVSFRGTNYVVPDDLFNQFKRQLQAAQSESDRSERADLSALGIRPREWLREASDEGTEEVGGVDAVHIASGVDVGELLDDIDRLLKRAGELGLSRQQRQQLPEGIPQSTKDQIVDAVDEAELDLFIGEDDKVLRKLDLRLKFDLPEDLRRQASGLDSGEIDFSYEVAELNQPQSISAPKSARPLRELQRLLEGSGFGSQGGSGSGGAGGGSSSGGSSSGGGSQSGSGGGSRDADATKARRYLRCVEGAKNSADLRTCADLLR